jgi:tetratricopeptide (TPR) repeat protein
MKMKLIKKNIRKFSFFWNHLSSNFVLYNIFWVIFLINSCVLLGKTVESKTFIAYSMKVAQRKVETAIKSGEDFRKKQPELYYMGGITKPWAIVIDDKNNDWILVGERDLKSSVLTLDDWVVALRARFIHSGKAPGVSIDAIPCDKCLKTGKGKACIHKDRQKVRFLGGIKDTHFGRVCYKADWLMKKISMALEKPPLENFKTYYDLSVEQHRITGSGKSAISSRFWFYPIVNRVNIIGSVVLLEKFQMGVFTEVLYAEINGKPVVDVDNFNHYPSEDFSRSFSKNYDKLAKRWEVLETLRGITRLAALAKGLTQVGGKVPLDFYLKDYIIRKEETKETVEVLSVGSQKVGVKISGGVELMALAMRFRRGDASAFKELILKSRQLSDSLVWGFEVKIKGGQLTGIVIPKEFAEPYQIALLFSQATFLFKKKYYDASIEFYNKILKIEPTMYETYNELGLAYYKKKLFDLAISKYTKAIEINPEFAEAYGNRGNSFSSKGQYKKAISDYTKAIEINPNLSESYNNRGVAFRRLGNLDTSLKDYTKAISINKNYPDPYQNRGVVYIFMGEMNKAIKDFNKSIELNPEFSAAYNMRGLAHRRKGNLEASIRDYTKAIRIDPKNVSAYVNRGFVFFIKGDYKSARTDWKMAVKINPNCPEGKSARHNLDRLNSQMQKD